MAALSLISPSGARAQIGTCAGTPIHRDTHVDPRFFDCAGTGGQGDDGWAGNTSGGGAGDVRAIATYVDLDADSRFGNGASNNESTDGDAIYGTIQDAVSCTTTGGTVHLLVPGVYREEVIITNRSVTIRGGDGVTVILDGGNGLCTTPTGLNTRAFNITMSSTGHVVNLENLTVRGYTDLVLGAIVATGTAGNLRLSNVTVEGNSGSGGMAKMDEQVIEIIDCKLVGNFVGLTLAGAEDTTAIVVNSLFERNGAGIDLAAAFPTDLSVSNSQFVSTGIGITNATAAGAPMNVTVDGSTFTRNGFGIDILMGSSPQIQVTDSVFAHHTGTGIRVLNSNASAKGHLGVAACRFHGNATYGIELRTFGGSGRVMEAHLWKTAFTSNGTAAVNANPGSGTVNLSCDPGENLFANNGVPIIAGVFTPIGLGCVPMIAAGQNQN